MQKSDRGAMKSVIPLTGGLGNQLFQYAFGLYLQNAVGHKVSYDQNVGLPRQRNDEASLKSLTDKLELNIARSRKSFLVRIAAKSYGWNLVEGLSIRKAKGLKSLSIRYITWVILCVMLRVPAKLRISHNLGYDSKLEISGSGIWIGYFQTFEYCLHPDVRNALSDLKPRTASAKYFALRSEIENLRPALVHLRLTDYISEKHFGVPSTSYYRKCLREICIDETTPVWVISDDIHSAQIYFSSTFDNLSVKFLDQSELTDIEVWDLMRYFSKYIISNSTFAWWAAFLRKNEDAPVYAPNPWFHEIESPNRLIPDDWKRVPAK